MPLDSSRLRSEASLLLAIGVGGGLGSLARYGVSLLLPTRGGFPWSTFLVNTLGCLLIGVLMVCVTEVWRPARLARPFLGVGLLGGFTTYSTAMLDVRTLGVHGHEIVAAAYGVGSLAAGLACVWIGVMFTRLLADRCGSSPRRTGDLSTGLQQDDEV